MAQATSTTNAVVNSWRRRGGSLASATNLSGSLGAGNAFSVATAHIAPADVATILANHAQVAAQSGGMNALLLGSFGAKAADATGNTFTSSAEYSLKVGTNTALNLNLLDGMAVGSDNHGVLSFSVSSGNTEPFSQSFGDQADALSFFSDYPLALGSFSGAVDLTLSMNSAVAGQGFGAGYLLTAAVPEPANWGLMGLGVAGLLACWLGAAALRSAPEGDDLMAAR